MSAPGVVLVHDAYGLTAEVREYADELTMAGFAVEAVDLFDGETAADAAGAERLAAALDATASTTAIADAGRRLRAAGAPAVGAVGFSLGGALVLRAAAAGDVDAVVAYDASRPPADAATTACPVQLHLAEQDGRRAPEDVVAYVAALETAGVPVDTFTYPGPARSSALDPAGGDPRSADAARSRAIGFLHARLSA